MSTEPEPEPEPRTAAAPLDEETLWRSQCVPGRSDWGLFACKRVDEDAGPEQQPEDRSQVFTYAMVPAKKGCEASIKVVKPISGAGTALMHGNFARRVSPSLEALSWRVATRRKIFKGARVLELVVLAHANHAT